MSPLVWIVQVPCWKVWLPGGTPAPTSAHVQPPGQMPGGGVLTALIVTLLNVAGVVTPVPPAVATRPARYEPVPISIAMVEPRTGVQLIPSDDVRAEKYVL